MNARAIPGIALAALIFVNPAVANPVEFSADTFQKTADGTEQRGKMYVGKSHVRTETASGANQIISIVDQQRGVQWLLFPASKSYVEKKLSGLIAGSDRSADFDPCAGLEGSTCERIGDVLLDGRDAVQWKVRMQRQGASQTMVQWIDRRRAIPLRSEMSNGQRMEMRLVGPDTLGGREVEKWESTIYAPGQTEGTSSHQWYDPTLNLVIREELPGGFVRELNNIKLGIQPPVLFKLPVGWSRARAQSQVGSR